MTLKDQKEFYSLLDDKDEEKLFEWLWHQLKNNPSFTQENFQNCMHEHANKWRTIGNEDYN